MQPSDADEIVDVPVSWGRQLGLNLLGFGKKKEGDAKADDTIEYPQNFGEDEMIATIALSKPKEGSKFDKGLKVGARKRPTMV